MQFVIIGAIAFSLLILISVMCQGVLKRRDLAQYPRIAQAVFKRDAKTRHEVAGFLRRVRKRHGEKSWQHAWACLVRGQDHACEGAYEESVVAYRMSIEIESRLPTDHLRIRTDGYEALANSLSILGRFDEAHEALDEEERTLRPRKEAPADDAVIATAIEMRARVTKREGDHIRSAELLERLCLLVIAPSSPSAGPYRGLPQRTAVDTSREALDPVETPLRLANALFTLGRVEDAIRTEQDALANAAPEKVDLYAIRAAGRYVRAGNGIHALRPLRQVLNRSECTPELRVRAAELVAYLDVTGEDVLAATLKALQDIPESIPGHTRLRRASAHLHFEADQLDEGLSLLGEEPTVAHASLLVAYCGALWRKGEHGAAQRRIVALQEKVTEEGLAISLLSLVHWHLVRGAFSDAQRALKTFEALPVQPSPAMEIARTIYAGAVLQALGRFDDATALYRVESGESRTPIVRAMALHGLGALHASCGRYSLAQELLRKTFAIYEENGADPTNVERVLTDLCSVYLRGGEPRADEIYAKLQGVSRARNRTSKIFRLRVDARWSSGHGEHNAAVTFARDALELSRRCFGERSPEIPECYVLLCNMLRASGQAENALIAAEQAVSTAIDLFGEEHPMSIEAYRVRGMSLQDLGKTEQAIAQLTLAERGMRRYGHENLNDVTKALSRYEVEVPATCETKSRTMSTK
ncbi:MAG: tetratricopeptide (TPR) repeat protein [Polyangiales bacterium]|jgi:tetratricopeptide (TPR) repeat protein